MRIFIFMKARLNLTIDEAILANIKSYAESKKISISALVENHFKNISKPVKHKNIVEYMNEMQAPDIELPVDLKKAFYEDQAKKYGF
ncbi:hypothetical protein HQ865_07915 [Mucilaginibacter mali]|uniref:Uncharacterized protein n=1 Tax=Mucilaginibacter mali TaxID=2740462 RepID=A0A7D4PTH3_9SPHI|nr:DUF6364 family protein [Mucilaginibacter mali]QKJ29683.1 hypothetical protein HQ865_07915 [Mucilaginibacter mali]